MKSNVKSFRFGATIAGFDTRQDWTGKARRVEDAGFDVLTVMDHYGPSGGIWGPIVAAADATTSLRFGTLVLNGDIWNPIMLAREAISADVLTEGRFELGIGAGWDESDYAATGLSRRSPGTRVDRLEESLQVLKRAFSGGPVEHVGEHYAATLTEDWPTPRQEGIPILVGGGSRKILELAGREADIVSVHRNLEDGVAASWSKEMDRQERSDAVAARIGWVRDAAGDRFASLELHALILRSVVSDDREGSIRGVAEDMGLPPGFVASSPHFAIGTVEEIVAALKERRERWGISYWTLTPGNDVDAFGPVVTELSGR